MRPLSVFSHKRKILAKFRKFNFLCSKTREVASVRALEVKRLTIILLRGKIRFEIKRYFLLLKGADRG